MITHIVNHLMRCGGILNGKAVCAGYSNFIQHAMQMYGIQCQYVTGTAGGGAHAWNKILVNGSWYWLDVTWGMD